MKRRDWVTVIALFLAIAAFAFGALSRRDAIDREAPAVHSGQR